MLSSNPASPPKAINRCLINYTQSNYQKSVGWRGIWSKCIHVTTLCQQELVYCYTRRSSKPRDLRHRTKKNATIKVHGPPTTTECPSLEKLHHLINISECLLQLIPVQILLLIILLKWKVNWGMQAINILHCHSNEALACKTIKWKTLSTSSAQT